MKQDVMGKLNHFIQIASIANVIVTQLTTVLWGHESGCRVFFVCYSGNVVVQCYGY